MKSKRAIEVVVGGFMLLGVLALFLLSLKVSGFDPLLSAHSIKVTAAFDTIGDLKVRAPVKVAGVRIGEVSKIQLDRKSFRARVTLLIDKKDSHLPSDSSVSILSASLLGSNYISITPGFDEEVIKNGGEFTETHPAIILENLLGQAIFTPKDEDNKKK